MGQPPKSDYPPLIAAGFAELSTADLAAMCVDAFPLSTTRAAIMGGLVAVVDRLSTAGISTEIWVNGSFMTAKIDPDDVDIVVPFPAQMYAQGTVEQRAALDWVSSNLKVSHRCDSYVFPEFPAGHPLHAVGVNARAYWQKLFGSGRNGQPKGLAVLRIN